MPFEVTTIILPFLRSDDVLASTANLIVDMPSELVDLRTRTELLIEPDRITGGSRGKSTHKICFQFI